MQRRATLLSHTTLLLIIAIIALAGCAPGVVESPERDTSRAFADQWQFPATVGTFKRSQVDYTGHGDGRQVVAAYRSTGAAAPIAITVTVLRSGTDAPAGGASTLAVAEQQFAADKTAVIKAHGLDVPPQPSTPGSITAAGKEHSGLAAKFTFPESAGGKVTDMDTHLYYFREGDWAVKYRVSFPSAARPQAEVAVTGFMSQLAWP